VKGVFLLDIEVELAWGFIDQKFDKTKMAQTSRNIRKYLDQILALLEKYQMPVTWGILGHVALDHCRRAKKPHPEMARPSYKWLRRDWYALDPCSRLEDEPAFYGKDIVDRIINLTSKSDIEHDIACHSFSHQLFGDEGCREAVAESEIESCLKIMKENYGLRPEVFIFPRDFVGHLKILRKNGFVAFRGPIQHTVSYSETGESIWNSMRRYASLSSYLASFYLRSPPPVVSVTIEEGLKNVAGSLCYNKKPYIPLSLITLKAKKGIQQAIRDKKIFHLYTHDINFGGAPDIMFFLRSFEEILAYAHNQRMQGRLDVTTIRKLSGD
jgi:peptidoglycan/xylan/chitin deacetylase (PgdA/CDA1 family)